MINTNIKPAKNDTNIKTAKIAEMIETLAKTAGTHINVATEYLESSIEFNATVYYLTEGTEESVDEEANVIVDDGFGRDYSLAFYNNDMIFGIPFEHINDVRKGECPENGWFLYTIYMDNGDVYRVGNGN